MGAPSLAASTSLVSDLPSPSPSHPCCIHTVQFSPSHLHAGHGGFSSRCSTPDSSSKLRLISPSSRLSDTLNNLPVTREDRRNNAHLSSAVVDLENDVLALAAKVDAFKVERELLARDFTRERKVWCITYPQKFAHSCAVLQRRSVERLANDASGLAQLTADEQFWYGSWDYVCGWSLLTGPILRGRHEGSEPTLRLELKELERVAKEREREHLEEAENLNGLITGQLPVSAVSQEICHVC